jgi:spore maturation protein A
MLNYIWISLVVIALLTAIGSDVKDNAENTYRNGIPLETTFVVKESPGGASRIWQGNIELSANAFDSFYGTKVRDSVIDQPASLALSSNEQGTVVMAVSASSPELWQRMADYATTKGKLTAAIRSVEFGQKGAPSKIRFVIEPIEYVRLKAVTQASLDFASTAVEISIGLIGIMALWLGLMKIAEEAGFIRILARVLAPIMRRLFPEIPSDHPAIGAMIMNIAASMLGLNNAATPLGLKAMEELNKLNPRPGTATNAMITFLTINTGGIILIPATVIAVRAASGSTNPGIIIGTSVVGASCATIAGVIAAKILQRLPRYKKDLEAERG